MDYDELCCEICLESYNLNIKVPKMLECCGKTFCLKCLKDIFNKNVNKIVCPICRKITAKNPDDLKVNKEILEPKTVCPTCHSSVKSHDLKIKIRREGTALIFCVNCNELGECSPLRDYLTNLNEEMSYFRNSLYSHSQELFDSSIEYSIDNYTESLMQKIKNNLKSKLKEKVYRFLHKEIDNKNISDYTLLVEDFKKHDHNITELKNRELKNADYLVINHAINFYINKTSDMQKKSNLLRKTFESLAKNDMFNPEEFLSNFKIDDLICSLATVKINNHSYNDQMLKEDTTVNTGISVIDDKFMLLRQENERLNNILKKKDNEIKALEEKYYADLINLTFIVDKQFGVSRFNFTIENFKRSESVYYDFLSSSYVNPEIVKNDTHGKVNINEYNFQDSSSFKLYPDFD